MSVTLSCKLMLSFCTIVHCFCTSVLYIPLHSTPHFDVQCIYSIYNIHDTVLGTAVQCSAACSALHCSVYNIVYCSVRVLYNIVHCRLYIVLQQTVQCSVQHMDSTQCTVVHTFCSVCTLCSKQCTVAYSALQPTVHCSVQHMDSSGNAGWKCESCPQASPQMISVWSTHSC